MVELLTPGMLLAQPAPFAPPLEREDSAARRTLRDQIARLERQLADAFVTAAPEACAADFKVPATGGPRLLGLAELEQIRDGLAARLQDARAVITARADAHASNRVLLERMLLDPRRHKYVSIHAADIGDPGCVEYRSVPRLGPLGALMGWWRVKVSSGCPLGTGR